MKKEIIFETGNFEPTEEFLNMLHSFHYDYLSLEARMDERVIQWIKENGSVFDDCLVYKGKSSYNYKIGFAGLLFIIPVDTEKSWRLVPYGKRDLKQVAYVQVNRSPIGMTSLLETREYDTPIRKETAD